MKYRILLSLFAVFASLVLNAQLQHTKIYNKSDFKKDKKMEYDGSSKFLFFYLDSIKIFPRWTQKEELELQRRKEDVEYVNKNRLADLEDMFPYPYEIAYPSYSSVNNDMKGCRYAVVVKYIGATSSNAAPFAGTSMASTPLGSPSGGSSVPKFVVMIYDTEQKTYKKIDTLFYKFVFTELLISVDLKFINKRK